VEGGKRITTDHTDLTDRIHGQKKWLAARGIGRERTLALSKKFSQLGTEDWRVFVFPPVNSVRSVREKRRLPPQTATPKAAAEKDNHFFPKEGESG
jgi:hypothetical protein